MMITVFWGVTPSSLIEMAYFSWVEARCTISDFVTKKDVDLSAPKLYVVKRNKCNPVFY